MKSLVMSNGRNTFKCSSASNTCSWVPVVRASWAQKRVKKQDKMACMAMKGSRRETLFYTALSTGLFKEASDALAIGPTDVVLENIAYDEVPCQEGTPKDSRCIQVTATGELKGNKPAYNGEVFGRVRYDNGESAIYGDFAEASDAGKIGDIDEIPSGKSELKFTLLLQPGRKEENLNFVKLKIRAYPGMRKNFRIMKPVADTLDTCDPDYDICD